MSKKHKGNISISRWSSNREPYSGISITIEDESSGTTVLDLDMTPEAFGNAVTGLSSQPCEFDFHGENIGKIREQKTEYVRWYDPGKTNSKQDALAPFEIDGWKGRESDLGNHHRRDPISQKYSVNFTRFVDKP